VIDKLKSVISSNLFFRVVVLICILQASLYAFGFQPTKFDEAIHVKFTYAYSDKINPFFSDQPIEMDSLGGATRNPNYLFYYVLSYPLRLIMLLTDKVALHVIGLRLIITAVFVWGLYMWRKLFRVIGIHNAVINVALLFLILTPSIAPLAGVINYDNVVFAVYPVLLLWVARVLNSNQNNKRLDIRAIAQLLIFGGLLLLIKYVALPLVVGAIGYVAYRIIKQHKLDTVSVLRMSAERLSTLSKVTIAIGLVLTLGLLIERPVSNFITYGHPEPACRKVLDESRCKVHAVTNRGIMLRENKLEGFRPSTPYDFFLMAWVPSMITSQTRLYAESDPTVFMQFVYYTMSFVGAVAIILYWRTYWRNHIFRAAVIGGGLYMITLFITNYLSFSRLGAPVALSGRYLLPLMPIFMVYTATSLVRIFASHRGILLSGLVSITLMFTQGGGMAMTYLTLGPDAYWQHPLATRVNVRVQDFYRATVKYVNPFQRI
jgi:hypothetical protein